MSSSRHPIALGGERQVGSATSLLALVMMLPLIDGLFPAMVLSGKLDSVVGIFEVGLLVFGGSATLAVILAEMDGSRRDQIKSILGIGGLLIVGAVLEAALAGSIASVLDLAIFERFAALVILAVAARTASTRLADVLPHPGIIALLGFVASVDLGGAVFTIDLQPELLLRAAASAGVGVTFALGVAVSGPWLRNAVDIDRFRFGSAVALGVLALSIFGIVPPEAPLALAVLVVTAVLAFDPQRATEAEWEYHPDEIDLTSAMADGGLGSERPEQELPEDDVAPEDGVDSDPTDSGQSREPWF